MTVIISQPARASLRDLYDYYKELGNPKYARKLRKKVIEKALTLKTFPLSGQEEPHLKKLNLGHRYLVEGKYKIIYRVIDDFVLITDVFDTRQNPDEMKT